MENTKHITGETELILAIKTNQLDTAKKLISLNQDVNTKNIYGDTPLSTAIALGNCEMVRLLISAGADVNYVDPITGFDFVQWCGDMELYDVIEVFLDFEDNFDVKKRKLLKKFRLHTLFV